MDVNIHNRTTALVSLSQVKQLATDTKFNSNSEYKTQGAEPVYMYHGGQAVSAHHACIVACNLLFSGY